MFSLATHSACSLNRVFLGVTTRGGEPETPFSHIGTPLVPEELRSIRATLRERVESTRESLPDQALRPQNSHLPAGGSGGGCLAGWAGRVRISSFTPEGKQSILTFIEPSELVIVEPGMREEHVKTSENTTLVLIPATEMLRLVETYSHISLGVTKLIDLRRKRIERRLKCLLFHSNRERMVHLATGAYRTIRKNHRPGNRVGDQAVAPGSGKYYWRHARNDDRHSR